MQIGWFQRAFRLPKPLTLIRLQDKAAVVRGRFSQFRFSRQKGDRNAAKYCTRVATRRESVLL